MVNTTEVIQSDDSKTQVHLTRNEHGKIVAARIWEVTDVFLGIDPLPTTAFTGLTGAGISISGSSDATSVPLGKG